MSRILLLLAVIGTWMPTWCLAQGENLLASIDTEGHIVLHGDLAILGVDVKSRSGSLIPPLGADEKGPFQILLSNNRWAVAYGMLGVGLEIDGQLTLPARYDNSNGFDLTGMWGTFDDDGPLEFVDFVSESDTTAFRALPEPHSGSWAAFGAAICLLAKRRRVPRTQNRQNT